MEKLKLSDIYTPLNLEMTKGLAIGSIQRLLPKESQFDFDVFLESKGKNLQRGLVWTDLQKEELIKSILKDIKLSSISLIIFQHSPTSRSENTYKVIDGKQRLTTMFSFIKNEFPLNIKGNKYYFNDLDEIAQGRILHYYPTFDVIYEWDDEMINDDILVSWFELLNFAGTPQDLEHLKNLKN